MKNLDSYIPGFGHTYQKIRSMVRGGRVPDYQDAVSYLRGKKDIVH